LQTIEEQKNISVRVAAVKNAKQSIKGQWTADEVVSPIANPSCNAVYLH